MKVLVLGATGNVGSRLVPSLLSHGHRVVAYVRSASKLESLLPASVHQQITVAQGDAFDSKAIKKAILDNDCDAIINTAGLAGMAPWVKSDLPLIVRAVVDAACEVGKERKSPLRAWILGGLTAMNYPGTKTRLSRYLPLFLAHGENLDYLQSLPPNALEWSMLCPAVMTPTSSSLEVPSTPMQNKLVANGGSPPLWQHSWMEYIPLIGGTLAGGMNASRYDLTLEEAANFIVSDLDDRHESRWIGTTVGIIDGSKASS